MSLPDWLSPLPDAEHPADLDTWAIEEQGIAGLELMERAGTGLADVIEHHAPAGRVVVVCGKGNNGGDGFVVARVLHSRGRDGGCPRAGRARGVSRATPAATSSGSPSRRGDSTPRRSAALR